MWFPNLPENSLESFQNAAAVGFVAECDVWGSREGEPVVIHDETLDRTTTGCGRVVDFTAAQLKQFRCKRQSDASGRAGNFVPVALLSEVAAWVSLVEIKPSDSPELVRRVVGIMAGRRRALQSFDPANLHHALDADSATSVALLINDPSGLATAIDRRWSAHIAQDLVDDQSVACLADAGLSFGVWTVNTRQDIQRVRRWKPNLLISDQPVLVREVMAARPAWSRTVRSPRTKNG